MGPDVVAMAKECLDIPLSVHLMLSNPDKFVDAFAKAGADSLSVHIEADCDIKSLLTRIRDLGVTSGIALNPETPAEAVFPVLSYSDEVLCMTVHPGRGGQSFMSEVLPKIRILRDQLESEGMKTDILVDGGIDTQSAEYCAAHGANVFIAGTSLFGAKDMSAETDRMRRNAVAALQ
jgi:ribulose-phosphate 3-epimerase